MRFYFFLFFLAHFSLNSFTGSSFTLAHAESEPDWTLSAKIGPNARPNPYGWDESTLLEKIKLGQKAALHYPVSVTGFLLPARPFLNLMRFKIFKGIWDWLGLHPSEDNEAPYPMGVSLIERNGAQGLTLGCAACHTSELFGKTILGMTNRFPRANAAFVRGKSAVQKLTPHAFSLLTQATSEEQALYQEMREKLNSVGVKTPITLGLDTSLAQVALSLARRAPTEDAERTQENALHPRENLLDHLVADSKPAVWWNVKYKNRWLSDGSVISGNPIFTNFLWNELGRGVDLPELLAWLKENQTTVQNLTTAVFATQAPRYLDFFDPSKLSVFRAKRGEILFNQVCASCHGTYEKDWSKSANTLQTHYFESTPVVNVGTDPGRRLGMKALEEALNPLKFSRENHIVIETQKGYVPPPLDGIWARYPYFHNNSIPNLCELMTPPEMRAKRYYAGNAKDPESDYDFDCVGYPLGSKTPAAWKRNSDYLYDTEKPGLSNSGHYVGIFTRNGKERFSEDEKKDLREYLKTL